MPIWKSEIKILCHIILHIRKNKTWSSPNTKNVCDIELSRDSPTLKLKDEVINEQVPMEFPYQPASDSSNS
jgi:hypothetical protein